MPLAIVAEVVTHGGYLPQLEQLNKQKKKFFSRRNVLGFSLIWLLFFLFIMTPFWGIVGVDELSGVSAIIGIFGGMIMAVSAFIFLEKAKPAFPLVQNAFPPQQFNVPGQMDHAALPPQQSIPTDFYSAPKTGNWRDTNDLQVGSVTENTTRLLNKDEM